MVLNRDMKLINFQCRIHIFTQIRL